MEGEVLDGGRGIGWRERYWMEGEVLGGGSGREVLEEKKGYISVFVQISTCMISMIMQCEGKSSCCTQPINAVNL